MGEYSIREILPFLPPSLVSTSDLPMDRSFSLPLPANGTEVKLSTIQAACPEVFGTPITPLNDSEVTLPPPESEVPAEAGPVGNTPAPVNTEPVFSNRMTAGSFPAADPDRSSPTFAMASTGEADTTEASPFAAPVAASTSMSGSESEGPAPAVGTASPFGDHRSGQGSLLSDPGSPTNAPSSTPVGPVNQKGDPNPVVPGGNPFSASGTTPKSSPVNPAGNASAAFPGGGDSGPGFVNPFAASTPSAGDVLEETPEETAPEFPEPTDEPGARNSQLHHSPMPAVEAETPTPLTTEESGPNPSLFGFPEPKKKDPIFSAFGGIPQPAPGTETPAAPPKTPGENAFAGLAAEMPDFAKLAEESSLASESPKTVSLEQATPEQPPETPPPAQEETPGAFGFPSPLESTPEPSPDAEPLPGPGGEGEPEPGSETGSKWGPDFGNEPGEREDSEGGSEATLEPETNPEADAPSDSAEPEKSGGSWFGNLFGGKSSKTPEPAEPEPDTDRDPEPEAKAEETPSPESVDEPVLGAGSESATPASSFPFGTSSPASGDSSQRFAPFGGSGWGEGSAPAPGPDPEIPTTGPSFASASSSSVDASPGTEETPTENEAADSTSPFGGTSPFPWSQDPKPGPANSTTDPASPFGGFGAGDPVEGSSFGLPVTPDSATAAADPFSSPGEVPVAEEVAPTPEEGAIDGDEEEVAGTNEPEAVPVGAAESEPVASEADSTGDEVDATRGEAPASPEPALAGAGEDRNLVFSVRELLGPLSASTGIDFSTVPAAAKVRFPLELVESQLATGEVSLTVADLRRYSDAETADLMRSIDGLLPVPIPENELYHQIQDLDPDLVPESDEVLESEFSTLFASEAENDSGLSWLSPPAEAVAAAESVPESEPVAEVAAPPEVEEASEPAAGDEAEPQPQSQDPQAPAEEKEDAAPVPTVPISTRGGKCVISVQRHTSPPAEEGPKEPAKTPSEPGTAVETEASPRIPGPLSPRPDQGAAELPAAEAAKEGQPADGVPDPFSPLPRAPLAEEEPASEGAAEGGVFFDDLASLAVDEREAEEAREADAIETSDEVTSFDSAEVGEEVAGEEGMADFSFSNFASLDDLEPFDPAGSLEWPGGEGEPGAPAASETRKAKPRREFGSMKSPAAKKAQVEEPAPSAGFFEELESVPPEAPAPETEETPRPAGSTANADSAIRDIELRAVFGTNEPFSYRRVADLAADLPGVEACAIVGPGMAAQSPRGREAGDLAGRAHALLTSARELARATGVPNAETFTLHTEQGVISVFSHGECCLTVRHAEGQFDPGVREKLILVVRGVSALDH